jgi:hypothetical protein
VWNRPLLGALAVLFGCLAGESPAAAWPTEQIGDKAAWDASFDAGTATRFIPLQLIVPGRWDGTHTADLPAAHFTDPGGDHWSGPTDDTDASSGQPIRVYTRERRDRSGYVGQRFAVRAEGDGLGRVYDSRFGKIRCAGEIKFPLGEWRQGETRENEYTCFNEGKQPVKRVNTIVIEKIDFPCRGVDHCLQFTWTHRIDGRAEPDDDRRYVFAPGLGEIAHDRR